MKKPVYDTFIHYIKEHKLTFWFFFLLFYIAAGMFGNVLSSHAGLGSFIYPSVGLAVGSVLLFGKSAVGWIAAGSLFINLWAGSSVFGIFENTFYSLLVTASSLIQAVFGGFLLRKKIGFPVTLSKAGDIISFLYVSPFISLISSSLSIPLLAFSGLISSDELFFFWVSGCIGDTLGLINVMPVFLAAAAEPRRLWQPRIMSVALPMLLAGILFTGIFLILRIRDKNEVLGDFKDLSQKTYEELRFRMKQQENMHSSGS